MVAIGNGAKLFHTPEGDLYAQCAVNGHHEIWPLRERGSGFRMWLINEYHQQFGVPPNIQALTQALLALQAAAHFNDVVQRVYTRVAFHNGTLFLDLANEPWEVVEITASGWRVITDPPVAFRRSCGMLPLPRPNQQGDIKQLRPLINVATDQDWMLLVAFLLNTLLPHGSYAHLAIYGEQGSAKSMATRMVWAVIDPHEAMVRSRPSQERDLAIAAKNNLIIALDNLSNCPDWFSDALCRLSTGAASGTRALYTDDEEALFSAKRPVILNGIGEVVTRGDLMDRLSVINLCQPKVYRSEYELWTAFEQIRPAILGGLLDVASHALRMLSATPIDPTVRLADFVQWVEAAAPALNWQSGHFTKVVRTMRLAAIDIEIDASAVAIALLDACTGTLSVPWRGRSSELYNLLNQAYRGQRLPDGWPGNAQALSSQLRRLGPALRKRGYDVRFGKSNGPRYISITRV